MPAVKFTIVELRKIEIPSEGRVIYRDECEKGLIISVIP
ncbi:hypothetical protein OCHUTO_0310 [Orientia chuto str. Dubai]|uniref:Uncharacterized protein n=1 Tax=Orientia chuto str. Dubai TaxID=1359168 RepID=A0A0F3MLV5_9RICK|nr:hypothetical protein OCHUTO_0310 [Orientia chuto str. Dubai]